MAESFQDVLTAAVTELTTLGYDSVARVAYWQERLRRAAEQSARPLAAMDQLMRNSLEAIYRRLVEQGQITKLHPGIGRFTIDKVRPQLRNELDRRIMASADLIRLNRANAIDTTLRRFAGWSTSIPKGGSSVVDKREVKEHIRKPLAQLPYVERRVAIDQGHKLRASISEVLATDGGAIAAMWHSHWRQAGYDYRPDHKERDQQVYLLKTSWAQERGFVKKGPAGFYEDITRAGEEPFCRCFIEWVYAIRDLPDDMVTTKGREALEQVRAA